jgi:TerB N-terminal domain/TerB-C domain
MDRERRWVPPGQSVRVAGHDVPGGLIYVGQELRSAIGTIEPALINPALPVGRHQADQPACDLGPAPSYHLISSAGRAAYLGWLAGGRDCDDAPIGCVSLFFAGLERRVLVDLADDPAVTGELHAIAAEVRRLQAVHAPAGHPFTECSQAFLDVLDLLTAPAGRPGGAVPAGAPPARHRDRWPVPVALRAGLASFALTGTPVPADWARSWAWYHPSLFPRTPETRCPQEFDRLFAVRYARRFTAGLVPQSAGRPPVRIGYRPASPGIDAVVLDRPDLPDVLEEPKVTRELGALADSVTDALTPYSRWLARTPGGHGSLASTALLPADLIDQGHGPLQHLLAWANAHLGDQFAAVIDASEFSAFWSTADPARMSRDEAEGLALVLHRAGLGVEPDVRFGGPALAPGPAVLFRLDKLADRDAACSPSPGYLAATTLLQLAATVVAAARPGSTPDGRTGARPNVAEPANTVITALAAELPLSVTERSRLTARLRWLLAPGAAPARPDRRICALTATEREAAGHFLIAVAAGPDIAPATVSALTRAYRLLGLDSGLVCRRLHRHEVAGAGPHRAQAEEPVVVRRGRAGRPGLALPRSPPEETAPEETAPAGPPRVHVSPEEVTRKMAETAAVSALLASIFTDDGLAAGASAAPARLDSARLDSAGLDVAHSGLLGELAARSSWSRADFADLAARHGVMPSGALDLINDVAMEAAGELAIEGDDELIINGDALRELLA